MKFHTTLIIILLSSLAPIISYAQNIKVWEAYYKNEEIPVIKRLNYIDSIVDLYRRDDIDTALYLTRIYLRIAQKNEAKDSEDYAHSRIASYHRYKGDFDSSIYYHELALKGYQANDFPQGVAGSYSNIANVYKQQSRYDLAIKNYFKAIDVIKELDNASFLVDVNSNLAGLYFRLDNLEKAEFYWNEAKDLISGTDLENRYTYSDRGLARVAIQRNEFKKAEEILDRILEIDKHIESRIFLYEDYLCYLQLYSKTKEKRKFIKTQQELHTFRDVDIPINLVLFYEFSGDFYFNTKDYENAKIYYDSCITTLNENTKENPQSYIEYLNRILTQSFYTEVFIANPEKFEELHEQLSATSKEAEEIKKTFITQELDAQYSLQEIQEENELLDQENKFYLELNRKNRIQIFLLGITLILSIGFVVYMIYNIRRIKQIQLQLKESAEEKELLYRELNHRVKNNLFIINSFIGIEKRNKSKEITEILTKIENQIHSLGLMHEILYQDKMEENINLNKYIQNFINSFSRTVEDPNISIAIDIDKNLQTSINKVSYIGLIINELMTNSCKYAKRGNEPLKITVKLTNINGSLQISVADDGIGLPSNFHFDASHNLKIIKGFTKQLKGSIERGYPEQGSEIIVTLPN